MPTKLESTQPSMYCQRSTITPFSSGTCTGPAIWAVPVLPATV